MSETKRPPYAEDRTYQYTERVFFDSDGNEIARERLNDDHWYDAAGTRDMTEEELEDYGFLAGELNG